jgi:hypothetical protein
LPQPPIPAPAARINPPTFTPIPLSYQGTTGPPQQTVRYPDMMSAAGKGLDLGRAIALLPRQAHEAAAQASMASIAQVQAKNQQDSIKQIQADKTLTPEAKTAKIQALLQPSGFAYGPQGGTYNPWEGQLAAQAYAMRQQQMQQSATAFPTEQRAREVALASTPAVAAGTTNPAPGATTTTTAPAPAPASDNPNDPDPDWMYSAEGYQTGGLVRPPNSQGEHLFNPKLNVPFVQQPRTIQGLPVAPIGQSNVNRQFGYAAQPPPATFLRTARR